MEANPENMAPDAQAQAAVQDIPAFEQEALDTQAERNDQNFAFEEGLGLPIPQENGLPPQPGSNAILGEQPAQPAAPVQDFSQSEIAPEGTNDQVRFEYWQSQAAQMKNQLDSVKEYMPMVDYLRNNPEAVQNITPGGQPPAQGAPTSQEPEEFPPPPEKPEQPRGFSREEALSDPNSESAIWMDSVEKWRDDMQTYGQLSSQYEVARMREDYDKKVSVLEKQEQERQHHAREAQEMGNVRNFVQKRYNLGDDLDDFITKMNDPKSINMDDLVGYYQFKKGITPNQPPQQNTPPATASGQFKQVQRAQSVPQPMGVQPAQNPQTSNSGNSNFMDSIIKDNNNKSFL